MAKEHEENKKRISEELTRNTILDKYGHQESNSDYKTEIFESEDGETDYKRTSAEHHEGSDGSLIPALLAFRPESQGGITIQRCDGCVDDTKQFLRWLLRRNQPQTTWAPAKKMRRCYTCRKSICERHFVFTSIDKHIRCNRCDKHVRRMHLFKKFLKFLFFKKV
ncbi:MAG: hypothetical protein GY845_08685 [Planctomycetes bacterium]|nr:hypothetical protein [Planctomycetota bacterium]